MKLQSGLAAMQTTECLPNLCNYQQIIDSKKCHCSVQYIKAKRQTMVVMSWLHTASSNERCQTDVTQQLLLSDWALSDGYGMTICNLFIISHDKMFHTLHKANAEDDWQQTGNYLATYAICNMIRVRFSRQYKSSQIRTASDIYPFLETMHA